MCEPVPILNFFLKKVYRSWRHLCVHRMKLARSNQCRNKLCPTDSNAVVKQNCFVRIFWWDAARDKQIEQLNDNILPFGIYTDINVPHFLRHTYLFPNMNELIYSNLCMKERCYVVCNVGKAEVWVLETIFKEMINPQWNGLQQIKISWFFVDVFCKTNGPMSK